jgi:2-phosphoglycerate kinase
MAKILVVDAGEQTQVPFLRGILTRSLQEAGVPFADAYRLANVIRKEFGDADLVGTDALREAVLQHLRKDYGPAVVRRYESRRGTPEMLWVRDSNALKTPFAPGQYRRALESCGLAGEDAAAVTAKIYEHLLASGRGEVSAQHLQGLTRRHLHRSLGAEPARRYSVWTQFQGGTQPLLLLIGGTAGSGKSTLATALADRLGILRVQSTDMLREVMRMMTSKRLLPVLYASSFNAWRVLPGKQDTFRDSLLVEGYNAQVELLSVACEAVIKRALKEKVSLILEGIHIQPFLLAKLPSDTEAVVVPLMLGVLKPEQLKARIRGRGKQAPDRRAQRYLENFDAIWCLQEHLLSEADRTQTPILANEERERTIQQAMEIIIDALAGHPVTDARPSPELVEA